MPTTITCPSGLKGEIRSLKIRDGRWLSNKQLQRKNKIIDRILSECWVSTEDPGIYTLDANGKPKWLDALVGDRDYALIAIRSESWGPYEIKLTCDACEQRFVWEIDLEEMLSEQGKPLSKESRETFKTSNLFSTEIELDELRKVEFKLATGADAMKAFQRRQKRSKQRGKNDDDENLLLDAVKIRLRGVDGIEGKDLDDFLEGLPLRKLRSFIKAFDRHDCGIDTTVEYECPNCGDRDDVDLPFDPAFFFPK